MCFIFVNRRYLHAIVRKLVLFCISYMYVGLGTTLAVVGAGRQASSRAKIFPGVFSEIIMPACPHAPPIRGGPNGWWVAARNSACAKFNRPTCSEFGVAAMLSKRKIRVA